MKNIDWERPLTEEEKEFSAILTCELPPVVSRSEVSKLTGNWLNSNTIKRDDSMGIGPRKRYSSNGGKKILYPREALVEYGIRRFGVVEVKALAA